MRKTRNVLNQGYLTRDIVTSKTVNGKIGLPGQNVQSSVGEVGGAELGNVLRKPNVLEMGLRRKIATKMTVSGQIGLRLYVFVKDTDLVQKRRDVRETEKKQFQIVTKTMPSVKVGYRCTVHKL